MKYCIVWLFLGSNQPTDIPETRNLSFEAAKIIVLVGHPRSTVYGKIEKCK